MMSVDNTLYQDILLKGFKGKGHDLDSMQRQHKKLIVKLKQDLDQTIFDMEQLVDTYDAIFQMPRKINLRIANAKGNKTLYWRMPGTRGNQPYIRIFQAEKGRALLSRASNQYVQLLAEFEIKRLAVNYRYSYLSKNIASIKTLLNNLSELNQFMKEDKVCSL